MTLPRINTGTYDKMEVREQYRTHLRLIQKSHPAIVAVSGLDHPPGGFLFPEWVALFTGIRICQCAGACVEPWDTSDYRLE